MDGFNFNVTCSVLMEEKMHTICMLTTCTHFLFRTQNTRTYDLAQPKKPARKHAHKYWNTTQHRETKAVRSPEPRSWSCAIELCVKTHREQLSGKQSLLRVLISQNVWPRGVCQSTRAVRALCSSSISIFTCFIFSHLEQILCDFLYTFQYFESFVISYWAEIESSYMEESLLIAKLGQNIFKNFPPIFLFNEIGWQYNYYFLNVFI